MAADTKANTVSTILFKSRISLKLLNKLTINKTIRIFNPITQKLAKLNVLSMYIREKKSIAIAALNKMS